MTKKACFILILVCLVINPDLIAQSKNTDSDPGYQDSKPWVYWYWMKASVSRAGIRADLIAMKQQGIEGAYLMTIQGKPDSLLIQPAIVQLSPAWWKMIDFTMKLADSLGFKLAMHVGDGFATAGGPWITPGTSMQKVVWSQLNVSGSKIINRQLPQPPTVMNYYRDIAVYAFPTLPGEGISTKTVQPVITTDAPGQQAGKLIDPGNMVDFKSNRPCHITYAFAQPFTCRSITIRIKGVSFQAKRLLMSVSNDGKNYKEVVRFKPSRSGWQDYVSDITYSVRPVTAKYFRFSYDPSGSEPGAEDLDAAKWTPSLKICGLELSGDARIGQFRGKSGSIWRISDRTSPAQIPQSLCIPEKKLINISSFVDQAGHIKWKAPPGKWTILRMGHTSTGQTNATGGGAAGLECDKFDTATVRLQFDHWFNKIYEKTGDSIASRVLKIFHVDSWECGSQNWSSGFEKEFTERRGYDPLPYLPVMAGFVVQSTDLSERFLYDIRKTIAELLTDHFFGTLSRLAHRKGCLFSAENTAPVMVGDGMLHFSKVDLPMGEFWLRSPTHDKPNDILDAVSGGHIYGKNIIQAESFTELRNEWDEYPGMLKTLQDRNYALGINRLVYHVFNENPWMDRRPGMTLGGVGLFFQRDQTWWNLAKSWVEYGRRCQYLLQQGHPVTDIAVYTGEEIPRRAVLPDRLVPVLPGLFGKKTVEEERIRLANSGNPMQHIPAGISSSANITTLKDWINPLNGYAYDSFNQDALLRLATVKGGLVDVPKGPGYRILVVPDLEKSDPGSCLMSLPVAEKLLQLVTDGATVLLDRYPTSTPGLYHHTENDKKLRQTIQALLGDHFEKIHMADHGLFIHKVGKGRLLAGSYQLPTLDTLGIYRDVIAGNTDGTTAAGIAWNHRRVDGIKDLYFISNQLDSERDLSLAVRVSGKLPELYDPVSGVSRYAKDWSNDGKYTHLTVHLAPDASLFVILEKPTKKTMEKSGRNRDSVRNVITLTGSWRVMFRQKTDGPVQTVQFDSLTDWRNNKSESIRYYSGTATYNKNFEWNARNIRGKTVWLSLGKVADIAGVRVNGVDCGTTWTYPYRVDITHALKEGKNELQIQVANTWANRLTGDSLLPPDKRINWTTAPLYLKDNQLLVSGLLGPVVIEEHTN